MSFLPTVTRAEHRGGYAIHLTFSDGLEGVVDFERCRDPAYFQRFFIEGGTVTWPNW